MKQKLQGFYEEHASGYSSENVALLGLNALYISGENASFQKLNCKKKVVARRKNLLSIININKE